MNSTAIANQIRAFSVLARIEAMKLENELSLASDNGIKYGPEHFFMAETDLENFAREVLTWGWQTE